MYLEHIEIVGFRGINRLSLTLDKSTLLIGENAWGKSSLLDALTLCLSAQDKLYHFIAQDFYYPPGEPSARENYLQILFTFCDKTANRRQPAARYHRLAPVWQKEEGFQHQRIHYRLEGELTNEGTVRTSRSFLNNQGEPLILHDTDALVYELIRLHPVLRLRDSRFTRHLVTEITEGNTTFLQDKLAKHIDMLQHKLQCTPQKLTHHELHSGVEGMQQLLEHYFSALNNPTRHHNALVHHRKGSDYQPWKALEKISQIIDQSASRSVKILLLWVFSTLLQAKSSVIFDPQARPLLLVEDPETRLHPIMLTVAWGILSHLPLQKVATTNSGELLSMVPIEQVCRLVRQSNNVAAYRIGSEGISPEEWRRITFHIRFTRASALFARCWLLVEGETEVWLLHELARQCGYHYGAEGIKIIEFAQCGIKPLIKFARRMGLEWHVLVDGDDAGRKYADTVRTVAEAKQENLRDRLTALPALDIEHFMYREGFSKVYHDVAGLAENVPMSARKVIEKAIHRTSKPDLAIAVASDVEARGASAVPALLRQMFSRVRWLARGRAD